MVGQFGWQLSLLHLAVEGTITQSQVHPGAVASHTSWNGVFNVESRIVAHKVSYSDLLACIEANVLLLLPKHILQDVAVGGFYGLSCFLFVEFDDVFPCTLVILLIVEGIVSLRFSHIGIVQFARLLNMYLCVGINFSLFK